MPADESIEAPRKEVLVWHDQIHESQDLARLQFWRFSFSPSYDRPEIFKSMRALFKEVGITSYTVYETLGNYDLLLRSWVPRDRAPDDLEDDFKEALRSLRLWSINYVICHTASHWADTEADQEDTADPEADPEDWPALDDPVIAEVSEFNRSQVEGNPVARSASIQGLVGTGALKVVPTDTRGVRFFIVFDHPRVPFNPGQRKHAQSTIQKACDEVEKEWVANDPGGPCPQVSIYEGTGPMTEFLIMARAPHTHFHRFVSTLLAALRACGLDDQYDIRPYTHVLADEMFSAFAEDRPVSAEDGAPKIEINEEETESLEYKATFALNLRGYIETGRQQLDKKVVHGVARATCGLLNSPNGGKLMLGVLETRRELEKTKDKLGYLARLREEFDFEIDPSEINNPPNALIGIEAEVGEGKIFADVDAYKRRLVQVLQSQIHPNPMPFTTIEVRQEGGRSVCVLTVKPGNVWFWGRDLAGKHDEFYVREAGTTRAYSGVESDLFKQANPRD
jgi:hypothetical protein